jgi:hypothetical protein
VDRDRSRAAEKAYGNGLVTYDQFQPPGEGARIRAEQEIDRLQFLSGLGLAQRVDERSWQLSDDHERDLRERQVSKDVIKSRAHSRQRAIDTEMDRVRERGRERNG